MRSYIPYLGGEESSHSARVTRAWVLAFIGPLDRHGTERELPIELLNIVRNKMAFPRIASSTRIIGGRRMVVRNTLFRGSIETTNGSKRMLSIRKGKKEQTK